MACHISCDPTKAFFRCESHDNFKFVKFEVDKLNESMIQLEPIKTINILMLGETGVGKSTWINGIANFLAYEKMENAIEGGSLVQYLKVNVSLALFGFSKMQMACI